jgi:hypothetical protein
MRGKYLLILWTLGLMLAGTASGLAQVWTAANAPSAEWVSLAYSTNGNKVVAVDLHNAIYLSTNFGFDWTLASAPRTNWTAVACSSDGNKIFATVSRDQEVFPWVASQGPIYFSKDAGLTWMQSSAPITNWSSVACAADGNTVLAAGGNGWNFGSLYLSRDSGTTWTEVSNSAYEWDSVAMSSDARLMIAKSGGWNFVSTNSGVTWIPEGNAGDFTGPDSGASPCAFSVGSADKMHWVGFQVCASLFTSDDDGTNWVQVPESGGIWQKVGISPDGRWRIAMEGFGKTWISYVPESAPWFVSQPIAATNLYEQKTVTLKAAAVGSAPMGFQWQLNGTNLTDDGRISGAGTAQLTISNLLVSDSGVYTLVATNGLGATNSTPSVVTVNADTQPPIVAITTPATGDKLTAVEFQMAGTASDNSQLAGVWFSINSGPWTLAQSNGGWNSWYANFIPTNGVNTISVFALDQVGNVSLTNTVSFSAILQSMMFVTVNGTGRVSPNYNQKILKVGARYSMTATPGKGFVFAGWTGGLESDARKLSFTMANDLSEQAVFVPNPFLGASGRYYGASLSNSPGLVGSLTAHVLNDGSYATTFQKLHFSGKFSIDGTATNSIPQKGLPPISVLLQLDLNGGNVLNATFTESGVSTQISASKLSK